MPFIGELTLDFCDRSTSGATRADVEAALAQTPRQRDWFLTLTRSNEEFIDVVLEDDATYFVHWQENGKEMSSASPVPEDRIAAMVLAFYEHMPGWQSGLDWQEVGHKRGLLGFLR
jgi:hypothetical protein